jgi:hypothetical protein
MQRELQLAAMRLISIMCCDFKPALACEVKNRGVEVVVVGWIDSNGHNSKLIRY